MPTLHWILGSYLETPQAVALNLGCALGSWGDLKNTDVQTNCIFISSRHWSFLKVPGDSIGSQSGEAKVSWIFATQTGPRKQQHRYLRWIVSKESCNNLSLSYMRICLRGDCCSHQEVVCFLALWMWAGLALTNGLWRNDTLGLLSPSLDVKRFHYIFLAFLEPWDYHVKKPGSTAGGQMTT